MYELLGVRSVERTVFCFSSFTWNIEQALWLIEIRRFMADRTNANYILISS